MGQPERLADLPSRKAVGSVSHFPAFPSSPTAPYQTPRSVYQMLERRASQYVTAVRRAVSLGIGNFLLIREISRCSGPPFISIQVLISVSKV